MHHLIYATMYLISAFTISSSKTTSCNNLGKVGSSSVFPKSVVGMVTWRKSYTTVNNNNVIVIII